ncbi:oligogalacturonate lyase family protein [Aestuariibaculum lutulentum]|uniref:Oligogalacturonate lyase family protein n=1 Tax=Aestuariibaculum lutulentum TaxID=2920935 RepID=A0ABS9RFP6_9FLAO|nr:oligogalacturonate lyase family protein [Aestuariibaculum lutulentum]MCH4551737.1 oligogalacturonate lyase family protein [Aestuariibaculum lutulentum]
MRPLTYLLTLLLIISVSCKSNNSKAENQIPVIETGKASSVAKIWIDSITGHKVEKLIDRIGDNRSFYFHNNPFLKSEDGTEDLMIFSGSSEIGNQFFTVNLNTKEVQQITHKNGSKRGEILGSKTRKVFYMIKDSVFATHIDTHETEFIYKFSDDVIGSVTTLNADETLLGGALITKEENDIFKKNPKKSSYFDKIYEAKLERSLVTINVNTKALSNIYSENAWLNHIQFSPTNPDLLMYCHEGPWHKVNRIWNINIKTKDTALIHKRTVDREIAGHEFFSPDGKTIWFDLQIPRSVTFYLAGKYLATGKETRYGLKRDEWSIHYNISPDQKTFAGDGGDSGQVARAKDGMWLYHFTPKGDSLVSEKLVNMKNHNYDLEPNVHFSPDGKQIIFRANFEGSAQIYAVDIAKHQH